jgi:hypothetical protein
LCWISVVFRMYARSITFPSYESNAPSPPHPTPPNSIRIFQANSIGRVELSLDENVSKCFWNRKQQPLLAAAYLAGGSVYILPLEPHPYNILRKYSGEGKRRKGIGKSLGRRRQVLWERDRKMSERDIVSTETSSSPRRSLGTRPIRLVALLQRIQCVGLDRCGWVAPLQRDQSHGALLWGHDTCLFGWDRFCYSECCLQQSGTTWIRELQQMLKKVSVHLGVSCLPTEFWNWIPA